MDSNLAKYNDASVVALYAGMNELQDCERLLFERHLKPGMAILDMGVGGGRTTPYLSKIAGRYVGADYSVAMVEACRTKFKGLEFRHCDATNMAQFADAEFDAVVFSFNGIDYIRTDESRARSLEEIGRVLRAGGIFIFSSHNAKMLLIWPQLRSARGRQIPWRILLALAKSLKLLTRAIRSSAFYAGMGYIVDSVHGGLATYTSTPKTMAPQLEAAGMEIIELVGGHYPEVKAAWLTPWHYYACRKSNAV